MGGSNLDKFEKSIPGLVFTQSDVYCPYCGSGNNIDHEDGHGYEEDVVHQQECESCSKNFTFMTTVSFSYEAAKADCLNGGDHKWEATRTIPVERSSMRCIYCDERRKPTEEEFNTVVMARHEKRLKRQFETE